MRWKLVPTEPTEEMEEAVEHIADDRDYHEDIYCCMLAAAPPASHDEELVEKVAEAIWKCKYGPGNRMAAERIARAVLKMLEGGE